MAGGNLGDLWVSLGIKETVSDGLKKVLVSLDKTDEKSAAVGKEIKSFVKANCFRPVRLGLRALVVF